MFKYKWWARRIEWPDLELPEHRTLDLSFNTIPVLCVPAAASCIRVTGEQIWLCMMLTELHAMPVHSSNTYSNIIKRIGRARVSSRTRAIRRILFFLNITLVYILYKGDTFHSSIELFCSRGIAAWSWEGLHAVYSRGCNIASYVYIYITLALTPLLSAKDCGPCPHFYYTVAYIFHLRYVQCTLFNPHHDDYKKFKYA